MPSGQRFSALAVVVVTVLSALYTLWSGNEPLLGLDLQGGVSVVMQPTSDVDDEALNQTVEIIRSRVDSLGVAEPEISRQGGTIVVDLPGVKEQQRALELVGQTAELRFRPVIFDLGPDLTFDPELNTDGIVGGDSSDDTTSHDGGSDPTTEDTTGTSLDDTTDTTADGSGEDGTTDTTADGSGEDGTDSTTGTSTDEESLAPVGGRFAPVVAQQETTSTTEDGDTTSTTEEAETTSTTGDETTVTTVGVGEPSTGDGTDQGGDTPATGQEQTTLTPDEIDIVEACSISGVTPPEEDLAELPVVLTDETGSRLCLGPTQLTGESLETAGVSLDPAGQWTVNPVFRGGRDGIDAFNAAAQLCYAQSPDPILCPSGRLAIVLDHEVVSAPSINAPIFGRDQIVISGAFEEDEARDLASVLRFGALPVELETQQTRTVSATIGDDVLRAGVTAGLVGLALVAVYLLAYYRLAGLVAISGLVISGVLLWAIISWFGENLGLALTLAGVVGLIVSVGVSADSNIVYFENVKDSYRSGRKVPTAVERAYQTAISTIVKADVVSLIAAALLYWLTVGAVRGFAFYLGLATILDLVISWLFMRPALAFLARRQAVTENPRLLGLPTERTS